MPKRVAKRSARVAGSSIGTSVRIPFSTEMNRFSVNEIRPVGVASVQQPSLQRVQPNDAANSYIIRKLEGAAGISGSRMPLGGPFLDQATIDEVKSWIAAGAQNN